MSGSRGDMATSDDYMRGFAAGWAAASAALHQAMEQAARPSLALAHAGDKPSLRRRGRPPKAETARRGRGRPRKHKAQPTS
jgi:hypothetical protein